MAIRPGLVAAPSRPWLVTRPAIGQGQPSMLSAARVLKLPARGPSFSTPAARDWKLPVYRVQSMEPGRWAPLAIKEAQPKKKKPSLSERLSVASIKKQPYSHFTIER